MLKRDSGAPFADHVAMAMAAAATEPLPSPVQSEGTETKESRRNTRRWSASRRFLRTSTRKAAKATVVMIKKGKEKVEEKDIISVIPQLRVLKVPRRFRR